MPILGRGVRELTFRASLPRDARRSAHWRGIAALTVPGKALVPPARPDGRSPSVESHPAASWQEAGHPRGGSAACGSQQEEPGAPGLQVEPEMPQPVPHIWCTTVQWDPSCRGMGCMAGGIGRCNPPVRQRGDGEAGSAAVRQGCRCWPRPSGRPKLPRRLTRLVSPILLRIFLRGNSEILFANTRSRDAERTPKVGRMT